MALRVHATISMYACCHDRRPQFRKATPLVYTALAGRAGAPSLSHRLARRGPTTAATQRTLAFGAVGYGTHLMSNAGCRCAALAGQPGKLSGGGSGPVALTSAGVTPKRTCGRRFVQGSEGRGGHWLRRTVFLQ
jgi:hypothetical protein